MNSRRDPFPHPEWHQDTTVLHGDAALAIDAAVVAPIHYSATFRAQSAEQFAEISTTSRPATFYTRHGNPVNKRVEAILAQLEGTETALLTGSGMGAICTTVLALLKAGDHVVAQQRHYMSTSKLFSEILTRYGVEVSFFDQTDLDGLRAALRPNTRLIMVETPVNPSLTITDLAAVAALAQEHGILTIADNTFASPLNQRPHDLGIDIVVHSATKYLGGHGDVMGGVIATNREWLTKLRHIRVLTGGLL
ncbi:MAG TPA: PLP-dependent aspartate aminotransferase family protein, partial [Castellaniella sp.]|nr:PLP-dependent aspartate aminotransferase family protein [Castellaniella sp.]